MNVRNMLRHICVRDMTHSYVKHDVFVIVPWLRNGLYHHLLVLCGREYFFSSQVICVSPYVCVRETERLWARARARARARTRCTHIDACTFKFRRVLGGCILQESRESCQAYEWVVLFVLVGRSVLNWQIVWQYIAVARGCSLNGRGFCATPCIIIKQQIQHKSL